MPLDVLGVVGGDYTPFQNTQLADTAVGLLVEQGSVQVQTAGSLKGNRIVWFLLELADTSIKNPGDITRKVDLPLLAPRIVPSRHGNRYKRGHVVEHGRHLFVSRGVGETGFAVRLHSPPEVPLLTLRSGG